ncbi:DUF1488 family protein [Collimonas silvisoli]|uniref:DUF1488 domain-containing protein n=1 Tax=Collimonas silvisoli TaxID=2825884 RepID=UPI001B8D355A|nr:DUF1488 domain-containing protein [Collimonas silvisoli]
MQISFLNAVTYDPNSDNVIVPIVVDDKLARCNVTKECLDKKFHAGPQPEDRLATYRGHRIEIQRALIRKLKTTGFRSDVALSANDFNEKTELINN